MIMMRDLAVNNDSSHAVRVAEVTMVKLSEAGN